VGEEKLFGKKFFLPHAPTFSKTFYGKGIRVEKLCGNNDFLN
jgi:hypothetical protein